VKRPSFHVGRGDGGRAAGTDPAAPTRTSGLPRVTARSLRLVYAALAGSSAQPAGRQARASPGPPAHIIAFQPSHMQPVGLTDFRLGDAPDQNRFAVLAGVDPVCVSEPLRLAVAG
jgi:hypothetical protein